jgi:hypothetical protein
MSAWAKYAPICFPVFCDPRTIQMLSKVSADIGFSLGKMTK